MNLLATEYNRRQAVAWANRLTTGTLLAPDAYEQRLLDYFIYGQLSLDQVECLLDYRHARLEAQPSLSILDALS